MSDKDYLDIMRCRFDLDGKPARTFTPRTGTPEDLTTGEIPSKYSGQERRAIARRERELATALSKKPACRTQNFFTKEEWAAINERAHKKLHWMLGGEAGD